jgi:hypothetical protein
MADYRGKARFLVVRLFQQRFQWARRPCER